jgi:flavin-dependent dehydrogenase
MTAYAVLLQAPASDADQRTWVEAAPDGWFYSALLPRQRRLIAFFTDVDLWPSDAWRSGDDLLAPISRTWHIRKFLDSGNETTRVRLHRFPAQAAIRTAFAGPGWIAVGDATLTFDPLSSQGIFHALYTGLRGAEAVLASDGGDANTIIAYEQRIRAIAAAYLSHRLSLYRTENRWQASAFWQRRQVAVKYPPI